MTQSREKLFLATGNADKVLEIRNKFSELDLEILCPEDLDIELDVEETGETLEENALLKARAGMEKSGLLTLADDTGLEVDALEGRPGIYSARFAGEDASYEDNNRYLLKKLEGVPLEERTARFVTVAALCDPVSGSEQTVRGICRGLIIDEFRGEEGFGYDPLFYLPDLDMTMAELDTAAKNEISHRARALRRIRLLLEENFGPVREERER